MDETESIRRAEVGRINNEVQSDDKEAERQRLTSKYGKVWDTGEATTEFSFDGFMAPFAVVTRRSDGVRGSLEFQHSPRFYFNFQADA